MLHFLLFGPFAAAVIMALASGRDAKAALRLSLVLAGILVVAGGMAACGPALSVSLPWFALPGTDAVLHYALNLDGIAQWLVFLTCALMPVALLGAVQETGDRLREFAAAAFALQGCMIGAFMAADLALFYIFFEAMLIPMLIILGLFGDPSARAKAGLQFFIYTMVGSVGFLVAIWYLAATTGTLVIADLPAAIAAASTGAEPSLTVNGRCWCFCAVALAFVVKTPLFPFHSWQAPVYAACPAGGAVLLAGVMAKLGTYGFVRFLLPFFPEECQAHAGWFITLGLIGVVGGALIALAQKDLKRLLAYSSLSHLGLVVVGIFAFDSIALSGAVVQMVAHGFAVGALFLLVGGLEHRFGHRRLDDFGGLAGKVPLMAVFVVGAALAAVALPGTAGFVGEFLLLLGFHQGLTASAGVVTATVLTAVAGTSLILGAVYVLRMVQRVLYGPEEEGSPTVRDLSASEAFAIGPVLILSLVFGVYPRPITEAATGPIDTILEAYTTGDETTRHAHREPGTTVLTPVEAQP